MKSIRRNKDIIFNNPDLIGIYKFKKFPVFMGCTNQNKNKDLIADMNCLFQKNQGLFNLIHFCQLMLFIKVIMDLGALEIFGCNITKLLEFINKYNFHNILEIGGLHGILSKLYNSLIKM